MKLMMVTHCSVIRLGRGCVAAGRMVVVSGSFKDAGVLQGLAFPHFMCIHLKTLRAFVPFAGVLSLAVGRVRWPPVDMFANLY